MMFAGFDLPYHPQRKYRVAGLDALEISAGPTPISQSRIPALITKNDIQSILGTIAIVKGKYEQELRFAFIQENLSLVPEDEIFSGNNQVYAEMRCKLRKQIQSSARRFGCEGLVDTTSSPS